MPVNPNLLRRCPVFADLPPADVNVLAEIASLRWFDRGDHLYRQGDAINTFFVILDGAVKISRVTDTGKTMVVDFRGPGQLVGGRALVGNVGNADDARAVEDALVACVPLEPAVRFVSDRPAAVMALARYLAARLEAREAKVVALSTRRVHQRLADALLELRDTLGVLSDGVIVINARLTQAELAEWIGTTRETTSTLLSGLRRAGHIDIQGRRINLLNTVAIENYGLLGELPEDLRSLAAATPESESVPALAKSA